MVEANFVAVFIGIESPDEESLRETKKYQNVREGAACSRRSTIQDAGLEVYGGMIVGFDNDDDTVFDRQFEFIQQAGSSSRWPACSRPSPRRRSTIVSKPRAGSTTTRPTTRISPPTSSPC